MPLLPRTSYSKYGSCCRVPQAHHRRRQARPAAPAAPASPANGTSKVWVPTGRIMAVEAAGCATASAAAPKTTATAPLQHVKTAASKIMAVESPASPTTAALAPSTPLRAAVKTSAAPESPLPERACGATVAAAAPCEPHMPRELVIAPGKVVPFSREAFYAHNRECLALALQHSRGASCIMLPPPVPAHVEPAPYVNPVMGAPFVRMEPTEWITPDGLLLVQAFPVTYLPTPCGTSHVRCTLPPFPGCILAPQPLLLGMHSVDLSEQQRPEAAHEPVCTVQGVTDPPAAAIEPLAPAAASFEPPCSSPRRPAACGPQRAAAPAAASGPLLTSWYVPSMPSAPPGAHQFTLGSYWSWLQAGLRPALAQLPDEMADLRWGMLLPPPCPGALSSGLYTDPLPGQQFQRMELTLWTAPDGRRLVQPFPVLYSPSGRGGGHVRVVVPPFPGCKLAGTHVPLPPTVQHWVVGEEHAGRAINSFCAAPACLVPTQQSLPPPPPPPRRQASCPGLRQAPALPALQCQASWPALC